MNHILENTSEVDERGPRSVTPPVIFTLKTNDSIAVSNLLRSHDVL